VQFKTDTPIKDTPKNLLGLKLK